MRDEANRVRGNGHSHHDLRVTKARRTCDLLLWGMPDPSFHSFVVHNPDSELQSNHAIQICIHYKSCSGPYSEATSRLLDITSIPPSPLRLRIPAEASVFLEAARSLSSHQTSYLVCPHALSRLRLANQ